MPRWAVAEEAFEEQLESWQTQHDAAARDAILTHYFPLCAIVAQGLSRRLPPHIDEDELTSLAVLGLFRAVDKFDATKSNRPSFWRYAVMCMRSTVLDGIRAEDWAPRSLRKRQRELEGAEAELECAYGREPTDAEIAMRTGWTPAQIRGTRLEVSASWHAHYEEAQIDEPVAREGVPQEWFETEHLRLAAAAAVEALEEFEQLVVAMRYYQELSLTEIALATGHSKAEVEAAHNHAVETVWDRVRAAAAG